MGYFIKRKVNFYFLPCFNSNVYRTFLSCSVVSRGQMLTQNMHSYPFVYVLNVYCMFNIYYCTKTIHTHAHTCTYICITTLNYITNDATRFGASAPSSRRFDFAFAKVINVNILCYKLILNPGLLRKKLHLTRRGSFY
jgi:hypothetical protein